MAPLMRALLPLLALAAAPASAALSERDLASAVARPAADARLPSGLAFAAPNGQRETLAQAAAGRPLVLLFADFTCRHVCGPGLTLTAGALHDSGLIAGRDYRLAVVGIDPKDGPAEARAFAARIAGLPDVARATTILRGDPATITAATRALGYGFAYDADEDQYAHDASVYVFAADGRLSALLPELGLRPEPLAAAIRAPSPVAPSFTDRVARLCYGLAADHGRYGGAVTTALQALAGLTIAAFFLFLWRRRAPA